jgi:hypothetical protein
MIGAVTRAIDNFLGRGEAAVTVPPLDGALRPNRLLDEAEKRFALPGVDCLAFADGRLLASAGDAVYALDGRGKWKEQFRAGGAIACMAAIGTDGLAVGLATGEVLLVGGRYDGRRFRAGNGLNCLTAIAATDDALYLANGSAGNAAEDWQRDLLERNASGSIWRIDLESGRSERLLDDLAWPAGIGVDGNGLVVAEAWRHWLVRCDPAEPAHREIRYRDLPGYPGRISRAPDGWWLAVFAPRSQLVEFILREPVYRRRMLEEVPKEYWVAPKLRAGRSFYEPLQGGGVKHLGLVKPWAPTMSAGLCVRLDETLQPTASLQSRADGSTHGVTSVVEADGRIYAAARGEGVVVRLPRAAAGGAS